MPRKLKVYQTSIGFFDLVVAVPSMKAALEIWGADSNLFHQGFASEVTDLRTTSAALDNPGIVLKRPVGTNQKFTVEARLPKSVMADRPDKPHVGGRKESKRPSSADSDAETRKTFAAYERSKKEREATERREEANRVKERERRDAAIRTANEALETAKLQHDAKMLEFQEEREQLDRREAAQETAWDKQRRALEAKLKKARG